MNDPGLDGPIEDESQNVEQRQRDKEDQEEQHAQAFLDPSRWWFASTAFPLVAGTFGPMASAFSICALVVHWRVAKEPTGDVPVSDPGWLLGINGAQLAIALVSNLFLLLNMARRVRFSIAQPVTILGWYLSAFTLMALTACAAGPLKLASPPNHAFSQAFYYATFSAGLYFIVATLMLVTVIGAQRGHYEKEFKLTMSQRTLMLQTISFLVYLLSGAAVYSRIENWDYLDAVYWADFTLLTVGIGDFAPETHLGRGLLFPFAIGGIIILGLVIGSIRSLVLERGKAKLGARMVEKERRRLVKKLHKNDRTDILDPVKGRDSQTSEQRRRREEFELMRRIQDTAATKRKWTSLTVSGGTWFFLWFVGAVIFQTCEGDWTYFVSLYFAYTSLLTIGYGDFYPISYSGKPFFVFWSLLAIPSLTILISNMGDTIVKGIRDLTIWVGNFTVLPGEQGARAALKDTARRVSQGRAFSPKAQVGGGTLGKEVQPHDSVEDPNGVKTSKNDPESAAQAAAADEAELEDKTAAEKTQSNDELPRSRKGYHALLITEISTVTGHLKSSPPRKYTFDEWAWYLKLIGEDESHPNTHRKAIVKPEKVGNKRLGTAMEKEADTEGEKGGKQWSWIGHRSPLMGDTEEADWVLERLIQTLRRELREISREEDELESRGEAENGKAAH